MSKPALLLNCNSWQKRDASIIEEVAGRKQYMYINNLLHMLESSKRKNIINSKDKVEDEEEQEIKENEKGKEGEYMT